MPKKYGSGELIIAEQLKVGDLFATNTKTKYRQEVHKLEITTKVLVNGDLVYDLDRPLILVQRDGFPVPLDESELQ